MTLVATMITLGLPSVVTREFAQARRRLEDTGTAEWLFTRSLQIGMGAWGVALLVAVLLRDSSGIPHGVSSLMLLVSLAGGAAMGAVMLAQARLAGLDRFDRIAANTALVSLTTFALAIVALAVGTSAGGVVAAYALANGAGLVWLSRQIPWKHARRPGGPSIRGFFGYAGSVSIVVLLDAVVWQRSEVLFLGILASPEQVAFYAVAFGVVARLMTTFPGALNSVLLSRFSAESVGSGDVASLGLATRYTTVIAVPMAAALVAVSEPLTALLYGPEFAPMAGVMRVLVISSAAAAIAGPASSFLYAQGNARIIIVIGSVVAVLNIGLDLWMIPRYGALGAAIANAAAQLMAVTIGMLYVFVVRGQHAPWSQIARILLAGLTAGVAGYATAARADNAAPLWGLVAGSAIVAFVFAALASILRVPTDRDRQLTRSVGLAIVGGLRRNQD